MSASSRVREFAKKLASLSMDQEGRVEEAKVVEVLDALRANPPRGHKAILRDYLHRIRREIAKGMALVEYAGEPNKEAVASLRKRLCEQYGRSVEVTLRENPSLLVGIRITVGDDVFEDSVSNRLRPLARGLT